ncbi:hypothetical protein AGABI2DRAFT_194905, partial [Agaricus bisporus var. bisporus H97]|uniref:hypothetical protein n=1 Tax=Agaricus bisporus var. bisporus (strain H97 / ATCC MYA-4626 / FGSC 10389) TaxID=936046 RepID=UPI00029F570E
MGRWTQYEEDSARLPTGMKRIGYDADTQRYKFQDEKGVLYESEPGSAYGTLRPIAERDIRKSRPNAFEPSTKTTSPGSPHTRSKSTTTGSNLRSFQDFLPSTAITSSPTPLSRESSQSSPSSDSRLPDVFSKVRSMTSAVSRLQLSHRPPEGGGRYQHIKSPS